ncbi:hypothetical protein BCR44DRAFT_1131418 [Catenaria anguillulae PL171]|uniref:Ig-like domain-containing protein n=1 Tax=Catenaria anguillulae PL171 TaxID=765915 RepID=A0A1Y2HKC2_9FUNG|nr:hypothetical protein BCR44DRAFT_1131418 [Catenaria anguillulae PL171]
MLPRPPCHRQHSWPRCRPNCLPASSVTKPTRSVSRRASAPGHLRRVFTCSNRSDSPGPATTWTTQGQSS